jgi:peroxiredoxin
MCTRYIGQMNEVFEEFEKTGVKMFHMNPDGIDILKGWMDRMGSMYDHISDTDQKVSKRYGMIVTHPEHPKVLGFTNRGFVLVDAEMRIRYLWRANRPNDTIDLDALISEIHGILG